MVTSPNKQAREDIRQRETVWRAKRKKECVDRQKEIEGERERGKERKRERIYLDYIPLCGTGRPAQGWKVQVGTEVCWEILEAKSALVGRYLRYLFWVFHPY